MTLSRPRSPQVRRRRAPLKTRGVRHVLLIEERAGGEAPGLGRFLESWLSLCRLLSLIQFHMPRPHAGKGFEM